MKLKPKYAGYHGKDNPRWNGGRTLSLGYVLVLMPGHPRSNKKGYVSEHILVAESALGRALPAQAVVHHSSEIRHDNRSVNLVICQDDTYHKLLHRRKRVYEQCGRANWMKCVKCGLFDDTSKFWIANDGRHAGHLGGCKPTIRVASHP